MSASSIYAGIEESDRAPRARKSDGLVYRGACDLVHIEDGKRAEMGADLAHVLDQTMRAAAVGNGSRTVQQAGTLPLCPGCYMVAVFNMAVTLAKANGQSMTELGNSMAQAFQALADGGESRMESIHVALDPDDDEDAAPVAHMGDVGLFSTLAHMVGLGGAM
jgi:hypothetical protein